MKLTDYKHWTYVNLPDQCICYPELLNTREVLERYPTALTFQHYINGNQIARYKIK